MSSLGLGWSHVRHLRSLAHDDEQEAVARLDRFDGRVEDVETAARIFERAGLVDYAESLRSWINGDKPTDVLVMGAT